MALTLRQMLEAQMHLGHRANKCNPKMKPFIYSKSNNYHLIDLIKSYYYTRNALNYLRNSASEGKTILFVGTKREAKRIIAESALECNSFYINEKWVGGLLTNWKTFRKSTRTLLRLERQQRNGFLAKLPKKEMAKKLKEKEKLTRLFDGIKYMRYLSDIVVIVGQSEELNAINECNKLKIRTVTLLDTDCNPTLADFIIPANDDSPSSIRFILNSFAQAIQEGQDFYDRHQPPQPKNQKFGHKKRVTKGSQGRKGGNQKQSQKSGQNWRKNKKPGQGFGQKTKQKSGQTAFESMADRLGLKPGQSPRKRRFQGAGETKPWKYVQRNKSSIKWKKQQKALPKPTIKKTLPPKQTVQIPDLLERPKWTPPKEESTGV